MTKNPNNSARNYTIDGGFSIFRKVQPTPELLMVTRAIRKEAEAASYAGTRVRDYTESKNTQEVKIPTLRVLMQREVKEQLRESGIASHLATLLHVTESVLENVPYLFTNESDPLRYERVGVVVRHDRKHQRHIVAVPDKESVEYLQHERKEVLQTVQAALGLDSRHLEWPQPDFSVILATAPNQHRIESMQKIANLAMGHAPFELTFDPAQFDPDPR